MKLKAVLLATAATLGVSSAANAYEGLYGAVGAGLNYMQPDRDVEAISGPLIFDSEADYDNGIGIYAALGYAYGNNWRTELEFSFRDNDVRHFAGDGLGFSGWPGGTLGGNMQSFAIMANVIYDIGEFGAGGSRTVTPYIGGGVGGAEFEADISGNNPVAANGFSSIAIDDSQTRLAYQGIAGLAFHLAEGLAFDISYRYFGAITPEFDAVVAGAPSKIEIDYNAHSVFAGLRWNFGTSEPAPAPVQYKDCWDGSSVPVTSDCPPQLVEQAAATPDPIEFTVYFDYDKSNLTPEAANLVREASARALANDIDTVVVEGNADRSGSSAYNQALSMRRANVVRDALIANGVPAEMIRTEAYGEDNPAKPTPDGVREPLNRRTEVTVRFE
ncbi:MAG: OmpA family protein [Parvularculaceae bacterium]